VIDLLEPIQRHQLQVQGKEEAVFVTELSPLQRQVVRLLGQRTTDYGK